jgi:hypothetical protein
MTTHMTVLKALEHRATRYQVKGKLSEVEVRSHCWGLDNTGTINMMHIRRSREEIQQKNRLTYEGCPTRSCKYMGYCQGTRRKG